MSSSRKLLIVDVAAMGWDLVSGQPPSSDRLKFQQAETLFPALTCVSQATFRTASLPCQHGMAANGVYRRDLRKPMFWEQSSGLVEGARIWDEARDKGKRVGMMFWQQSLGESVDLVLSPRPIHKHNGGMIQACYSNPPELYEEVSKTLGRPFNLMHYWGPLASRKSSEWIVAATSHVMKSAEAPDVLFSYIPHLDYDLQRFGPGSDEAAKALEELYVFLDELVIVAEESGYDFLFFGDYAIAPVTGDAVFPNRHLREAGLFKFQDVKGMLYPDFFDSRAFAIADHEIAHIYIRDEKDIELTRETLTGLYGISMIMDREVQAQLGVHHPHAGDLILIAEDGCWFAYPWWTEKKEAPDFASHIDIHNKPGYDPCELFWGWPPMSVSQDTSRIRGSHGRLGRDRTIAWATSLESDETPTSILELAAAAKGWIDRL